MWLRHDEIMIFLHSIVFVQTIGKLTSDQQSLEAKLAEMERLKAAADESSAEERYLTNSLSKSYTYQY